MVLLPCRSFVPLAAALGVWLGAARPAALPAAEDALNAVAVSADAKLLAAGGQRDVIILWDLPAGKLRQRLPAESPVYALAFAPDGRTLAAGMERAGAQLWERGPEGFERKERLSEMGTGYAVAFSPDGKRLAYGTRGAGWIYLHEVATRRKVGALFERSNFISGLAFAPDGQSLASAGNGFRRWDVRPETLAKVLSCLTPGQSTDLIVEAVRPAQLWKDKLPPDPPEYSAAVAFSSDGKLLAGVNGTGGPGARAGGRTFRVWDAASGVELRSGQATGMRCVAFLKGDKQVVTGSDDGKLRVWSVDTGMVVREWSAHPKEVRAVAVIPDIGLVVSAGEDGTVRVWDPETGAEKLRLAGPG
jgi:WD40 repeat protein